MARYLRSRNNGAIYDWDPILAENPACEELTEQQAFPERFIPPAAEKYLEPAVEADRKRGRPKKALDLSTADIPEPPPYTDPDLAREAAKGFPS